MSVARSVLNRQRRLRHCARIERLVTLLIFRLGRSDARPAVAFNPVIRGIERETSVLRRVGSDLNDASRAESSVGRHKFEFKTRANF